MEEELREEEEEEEEEKEEQEEKLISQPEGERLLASLWLDLFTQSPINHFSFDSLDRRKP